MFAAMDTDGAQWISIAINSILLLWLLFNAKT